MTASKPTTMTDASGDNAETMAMRERVQGTNINEQTLLATDYLNHFNEVVMLLEMIVDMPDLLDEAAAWQPKSYQDHFRESTFSDAALAVEAYDHVPERYKQPFEKTVGQLNTLIRTSIERIQSDLENGTTDLARENAAALSQVIQRLQDVAGGIIHGSEHTVDQSEIDAMLG